MFAKLYFPRSDPLVGTLEAFAIYAVGFAARPIGAAIFGHWGDRLGRKSALIATLMLMGIATFLVGLVPTYESIGIWGAILLTVLRFIQGVGVGGEWGGSVLLSMEWARTSHHRGFVASWPQFGVPSGLFLANLAVLVFSSMSGDAFLTWGWRVPFLISIVLVGIGLWIRLGILETPTFRRLVEENRIERPRSPRCSACSAKEVFLSAFARMAEQAPFYIFTAFVFAYGVGTLKVSRDLLLVAVLAGIGGLVLLYPIAGHLSDRFGRKRVYIIGAVVTGLFGWVYFALLEYAGAGLDLCCDRAVADSARRHVWAAGGTHRGELHRAVALHRCVDRISACLDHRRRAGATDCRSAVRFVSVVGGDCRLHHRMCGDQRGGDGADAGLHREGYIGGVCVRRSERAGQGSTCRTELSASRSVSNTCTATGGPTVVTSHPAAPDGACTICDGRGVGPPAITTRR